MPFAKDKWAFQIKSGDLVYGVNSPMGRKKYMNKKSGVGKLGFTVDSLSVVNPSSVPVGTFSAGQRWRGQFGARRPETFSFGLFERGQFVS